jgi:hypothetical protein
MTNITADMITATKFLSTIRTTRKNTIFYFKFTFHSHLSTKNSLHHFTAKARGID